MTIYAEAMGGDAWTATGETIKFDTEGRLLDGQHRLHAVIKSGKTVEFLVARNVPHEAFHKIDTGKARTGADVLTISGIEAATSKTAASVAALAMSYKTGIPSYHGPGSGVRNSDVLDFCLKHDGVMQSAAFVNENFAKGSLLSRGILGWVSYETRKIDKDLSDLFILDILVGSMLKTDDPVYQLRDLLIKAKSRRDSLDLTTVLCGIVRAWNWRRDGRRRGAAASLMRRDWQKFPRFL